VRRNAWSNGILYSNGNQALRHLGVPTVTVPMGLIADKQMPVGLTFAGRAYDDVNLLKWANAFENKTKFRTSPTLAPPLQSTPLFWIRSIALREQVDHSLA
jgi:amidase